MTSVIQKYKHMKFKIDIKSLIHSTMTNNLVLCTSFPTNNNIHYKHIIEVKCYAVSHCMDQSQSQYHLLAIVGD